MYGTFPCQKKAEGIEEPILMQALPLPRPWLTLSEVPFSYLLSWTEDVTYPHFTGIFSKTRLITDTKAL